MPAVADVQAEPHERRSFEDPFQKGIESRDIMESFIKDNDYSEGPLKPGEVMFGNVLNYKYLRSQRTRTFKNLVNNIKTFSPNLEDSTKSGGGCLKRVKSNNNNKDKEETIGQFTFPLFRRSVEHLAKNSGCYLKRIQNDINDKEETDDEFISSSFPKRNLEHLAKTSGGYLKIIRNDNDNKGNEETVEKLTFPIFPKINLEHLAKSSGGYLKRIKSDNTDKHKDETDGQFILPHKRNLEHLAKSSGGYLNDQAREEDVDQFVSPPFHKGNQKRLSESNGNYLKKVQNGNNDTASNHVDEIVNIIDETVGNYKRGNFRYVIVT